MRAPAGSSSEGFYDLYVVLNHWVDEFDQDAARVLRLLDLNVQIVLGDSHLFPFGLRAVTGGAATEHCEIAPHMNQLLLQVRSVYRWEALELSPENERLQIIDAIL